LVAVGFTRELGPLLTAIAVSGRSGSSFAAEIDTMKVTEGNDKNLEGPRGAEVRTSSGSFGY
jgi:hypothetical protein